MSPSNSTTLIDIIRRDGSDIVAEWLHLLRQTPTARHSKISDADIENDARQFSRALMRALESGHIDIQTAEWSEIRDLLGRMSESRAIHGVSPSETATFVLSLKQPIFGALRRSATDADQLADLTWTATTLVDQLGLLVTELHQKARDSVIARQQQEMLELSTPVITLWEGVLALPVIGTLDSARTQIVMESLLQRIVDTGSVIAILDITGVPTVDTLVAQHLLKTVAAARLMGADCIISGIRPQIAQTIVHLGVDLNAVTTKATLADAFALALRRLGKAVTKTAASGESSPLKPALTGGA
jgi:rsbT co-antagonist protein RsbR